MDMSPFASQVTHQNILPHYITSQSQLSSIQMPQRNIYFPNHPYPRQHHACGRKPQHLTLHPHHPTMQAPQYKTPLHQAHWHHAPLIPFPTPPYQMSLYQRLPMPSRQPTYPGHNAKITRSHIRKNLFKVEERLDKTYTPLTEPIGQLYEKLRIACHIAPMNEIKMTTRASWIEPSKICAYHSGMEGHTIEQCRDLKDKIQQLIDTKAVYLEDFATKGVQM